MTAGEVSHADGDGHVIAEQVRRNLSTVPTFDVRTVVDPSRTKDHKTWMKLSAIPKIEPCEIVFFVDLMFAPASFAAAPGGPLAGERLLALMRADRWHELRDLGRDDPKFHRLPRGLRPAGDPISDLMKRLVTLAVDLLKSAEKPAPGSSDRHPARSSMSYDFETAPNRLPPTPSIPTFDYRDLESIVTLLELAAICLTHTPEATFSSDELIAEARKLGGADMKIDEADVKIVLGKAGFLQRIGRNRLRIK